MNTTGKKGQFQFQENNLYFYLPLKLARSVILDIKNKRKDWKIKKIKLLRTHKDLYILSLYKADTLQDVFFEETNTERPLSSEEKKAFKSLKKNTNGDLSRTNKNEDNYLQTPARRESMGSPFYERCLSAVFNFMEEDFCLRRLFASPGDNEDVPLSPEDDSGFLSFSQPQRPLSFHRLRRAFRRAQPIIIQPEEAVTPLDIAALRKTRDEDDDIQTTDLHEEDLETYSVSTTDSYLSPDKDDSALEHEEESSPVEERHDEPDFHLALETSLLQASSNENENKKESVTRPSLLFLAFGTLASLPPETEDFEQTLLSNLRALPASEAVDEESQATSSEQQKKHHNHHRIHRPHRLSLPPFLGTLEPEHSHNRAPRRWSTIVTAKERRQLERREYDLRNRDLLRRPRMGCPACGTMVCIGDL